MIGLTTKTFALLILIMLTVQSYLVSCLCKLVVELWIWVTTRGIEPGSHWPWSNVHATTPGGGRCDCKIVYYMNDVSLCVVAKRKIYIVKTASPCTNSNTWWKSLEFWTDIYSWIQEKTRYSLNSLMHDIRHEFSVYKSARSFCTIRSISGQI